MMFYEEGTLMMTNRRPNVFRASVVTLCISMFSFMFILGPALAANVTVNGVVYDIQFMDGSFNNNEALLTNTDTAPWWGSKDSAAEFGYAYWDQVGSPRDTTLTFSYGYGIFNTSSAVSFYNGTATFQIVSKSYVDRNRQYATATLASASSVPEINAGSLSHAFLILFALWLVVRRRESAPQARSVQ